MGVLMWGQLSLFFSFFILENDKKNQQRNSIWNFLCLTFMKIERTFGRRMERTIECSICSIRPNESRT